MASTNHAFLRNLLHFGRVLRRLGLDVHPGRIRDVADAIQAIGLERRSDVRAAMRTLLLHRREDLARFDEAFDLFWRDRGAGPGGLRPFALGEQRTVLARQEIPMSRPVLVDDGTPRAQEGEIEAAQATYSPRDVLRTRDFADFGPDDLAEARRCLAAFHWDPGSRVTRRWEPGRGSALDLRRALRRTAASGGDVIDLPRRTRVRRPRPLVVLCDVSGSMERYARMLLHFIGAVARRPRSVEAFLFATRLTRITRHLSRDDRAGNLGAIPGAVPDWAGGTRIGEALGAFNRLWARRVLRRGPVVLLISDGWDRGDPVRLGAEIARLQRSCHRLVWLNPLLGSPVYEPLTRGMQAALPYVDDFLPVHNLDSLESLARHLSALGPERRGRRSRRVDTSSRAG